MPKATLMDMLSKLFLREGVAIIKYDEIRVAFSIIGKEYDMGDGKWIKPALNDDKQVLLKLFMPRGTYYKSNMHPDCYERLIVITGEVMDKRSRLRRCVLGSFNFPAYTPHYLEAIEDSIIYARFKKVKE